MKELIVITGSSSGIGKAAAERFSREGHPLLLLSRRGRQESDSLPYSLDDKVDITDLAAVERSIDAAQKQYGPVGCLVNNAGAMYLSHLGEQNPEEWQRMLDVNLKGLLHTTRAVVGVMREQNRGTIINISSVAGRYGFEYHAAYCATKWGVHGLTEAMRMELGRENIRCTTISPGIVETELLSHTQDARVKAGYEMRKRSIGELLSSDEVADAIWYVYNQPQHICIRELTLCPTRQPG